MCILQSLFLNQAATLVSVSLMNIFIRVSINFKNNMVRKQNKVLAALICIHFLFE